MKIQCITSKQTLQANQASRRNRTNHSSNFIYFTSNKAELVEGAAKKSVNSARGVLIELLERAKTLGLKAISLHTLETKNAYNSKRFLNPYNLHTENAFRIAPNHTIRGTYKAEARSYIDGNLSKKGMAFAPELFVENANIEGFLKADREIDIYRGTKLSDSAKVEAPRIFVLDCTSVDGLLKAEESLKIEGDFNATAVGIAPKVEVLNKANIRGEVYCAEFNCSNICNIFETSKIHTEKCFANLTKKYPNNIILHEQGWYSDIIAKNIKFFTNISV